MRQLFFATTVPAYADKTNATAVHAALRLPADALAVDMAGAVRSGVGALVTAAQSPVPDDGGARRHPHRAAGQRRRAGRRRRRGRLRLRRGQATDLPVLAEIIGQGSATAEFLDRWRTPGAPASRVWEERFGEQVYGPLAEAAIADALKQAGLTPGQVDHLIVAGLHARAVSRTVRAAGVPAEAVADNLVASIGNAGTAQPGILLADVLDRAGPDEIVLLVVLADGATALVLRTTEALAAPPPAAAGRRADRGGQHARWSTPPSCPGAGSSTASRPGGRTRTRSRRRPRSAGRTGSSGSSRSKCTQCGTRSLPPDRVCQQCHAVDEMATEPLADVPAHGDHLHRRPARLHAEPADAHGGDRLRRRRPDALPAHRRRRGRGAGRAAGRDDLPAADHRRRRPQLLLEGPAGPPGKEERMGSHGIRDQVAIVGMGCTAFGEHWDKSADDLLVESATAAAAASAGIAPRRHRRLLARHDGLRRLRADASAGRCGCADKPVTRLENMCATGSEALRNACYAVASGAYDCAMAIGVEKLKDSGFSGLAGANPPGAGDDGKADTTAPANFSLLAPAYAQKYGVDPAELKDVLTRIAWKNHHNGAQNPRAQFRKEVPKETIKNSPLVAGMLGVFDCSGVSDGSAAAIVVRAEDAHRYTDKPLYVKALSFVAGPADGLSDPDYDFTTFPEVVASARDAYPQAGDHRPARRARPRRGARLLHPDRAGADGGPRLRRARAGLEGRAGRHASTSTASCRSTPTAG